ncbi:hypothetical protein Glove_139g93 [Diversispora epigaea]|uniref:DUF6570 domain-containing protein n=1 Tax=Diversispora epigaea TaxID=1348612 RepID=A0A397J5A3_9GLOM|nr:hypothetical protein Glove_139g93 [Diversispora epigaea]
MGYICINLIQLNNRRHTHHKLKGHVITFTQELTSLSGILPLPVYQLCDHLKVVFVGDGQPSDEQLKKVLCEWPIESPLAGYIQAKVLPYIGSWIQFSPAIISNLCNDSIEQPQPMVSTHIFKMDNAYASFEWMVYIIM